jgi:uncharacterized protein with GYD domain
MMPKYMVQGSYSVDGVKGVLAEGGSARMAEVKHLLEAVGGALEVMYFTFGSDDFIIIADGPDNATTAALTMMVSSTGAVKVRTTVLLTPEEIDAATKTAVSYRPPGK